MSQQAYDSLLNSLNSAIETLDRNRTPDPAMIAAFDTLKQARAMIVRALETPRSTPFENSVREAA